MNWLTLYVNSILFGLFVILFKITTEDSWIQLIYCIIILLVNYCLLKVLKNE